MTQSFPLSPNMRDRISEAADQYERLAADLRRVLADGYPEPDDSMPLMDNFTVTTRTVPCLRGTAVGHPTLVATEPTTTSAIALLSLPAGLVRTQSRWYRLGQRLAQDDLPVIALGLDRGA
ncbi:hypothetical protein ASG43_21505 [Aureimonas sp. Leaf454]|uniref:hypothetical protein n=1 Tax=Aureimonas sp. Leaf454 TaxID=1736381 RepID=UPI0006FBE053|nr:hypothetical protein [Aureimonas sp. Leaf454]KQT51184.1 hypothetical protein ASG43_21505 [Aureimonas sp. Leaf454]